VKVYDVIHEGYDKFSCDTYISLDDAFARSKQLRVTHRGPWQTYGLCPPRWINPTGSVIKITERETSCKREVL
jgi:hypothetical protein